MGLYNLHFKKYVLFLFYILLKPRRLPLNKSVVAQTLTDRMVGRLFYLFSSLFQFFFVCFTFSLTDVSSQEPNQVKYIRSNGRSYLYFNMSLLPSTYFTPANREEFQFWFFTQQPDGLIWSQKYNNRPMFVAMEVSFIGSP